ncbi:MAG: hypothetical protein IJ408_01720 [Clostridia bacterium]|nr:hypothetical protein [Clostridia bacterium]
MASIYDKSILSEKDLERIEQLGKLWQSTNDAKARDEYHQAAETIRRGYGYSGGGDGHQYDAISEPTVSTALAAKDYADAVREAEKQKADGYAQLAKKAEADGDERLRQAYIKNMQQSLGIAQALKADGLTGGITESTRAALSNGYLSLRDDIMKDVSDNKRELSLSAAQSAAEADKEIARSDYEAAGNRAQMMSDEEQKAYDRAQDAYEKKYREQKDKADREWEEKLFEYQKSLDTYDREYQKQQDALDRQAAAAKKSTSKSSSSSSTNSALEKERERLRKEAWELLEKGVFDESFPELLGYSKEVLLEYMNNSMAGF